MEQYVPQTPVAPVQQTMITSIDGNVELQTIAQPTTIGTNKIKINITKNVHLNKNPINSSESIDNNLEINDKEIGLAGGQKTGAANNNNKNCISNDTDQHQNGAANQANSGHPTNQTNAASDSDSTAEIEYEVKDSIKHVQFERRPVVKSGLETSGLCSIM